MPNPKFSLFSETTSGDHEVIAAVTGRRIRVHGIRVQNATAGVYHWKSGSTRITQDDGGQQYTPYSEVGLFETAPGEALNINLGSNGTFDGQLTYSEV